MSRKKEGQADSTINIGNLLPEEEKVINDIDSKISKLKDKRKKEAEKIRERQRKERDKALSVMEKTITSILERPLDESVAASISTYLQDNSENVIAAVLGEADKTDKKDDATDSILIGG